MLMPKRVKYRKAQRGRMKGTAQRGATLAFGEYGLKALEPGWVTGKGKGNPEEWVAVVKPGRIMYEMQGVPEDLAREAFRTAGQKMGIATKFVMRTRAL